jgi:1,2-phenylacetyl-CoA epoxidase catalytic subunit
VQKILGIARFVANGVAELELGRDSRRGEVMITLVKNWQRILQMDKDDLVRVCYDWQIHNVQYGGWAKKLEKELNKIGLEHSWQNPTENQRGTVCKEVKERCNDIERHFFTDLREAVNHL